MTLINTYKIGKHIFIIIQWVKYNDIKLKDKEHPSMTVKKTPASVAAKKAYKLFRE